MNTPKSRGWIFTLFVVNEQTGATARDPLFAVLPDDVRFICWQKERGGNTNREHYQGKFRVNNLGFIKFKKQCRLAHVKDTIGSDWVHLEIQRGNDQQAADYGMKEDTRIDGPWSLGEQSSQGKRSDLIAVAEMCKSKRSYTEIAESFPVQCIKFERGIRSLSKIFNPSVLRLGLEVIVIIGPTRCGKTKWASINYPNFYRVPLDEKKTTWFDGYDAHDTILLDDFEGQISRTVLLNLLDVHKLDLPYKGGFTPAHYKRVIITSNLRVEQWYPFVLPVQMDALKARFTKIYNVYDGDEMPPDRIDRHFEN